MTLPSTTPLRAIILDFDGVILESNELKTMAFERVFARFSEYAADMMAYHHAHVSESRFAKFTHLVTDRLGRPPDDPLVAELAGAFSAEMLRLIGACPMVPGAAEFLSAVGARVPLYLASVTPQEELEVILDRRGLSASFARVYGCPPWPKAQAIREILASVGTVGGVLFVGDSAGDQRAAHETGVEFIARDSGLPFAAPPPRAFADMHGVLAAIAGRLPLLQTARPAGVSGTRN